MPPKTSPEKCSMIVTIYKYCEAESEERQKYVSSALILTLIDYILVDYTVGSMTFLNSIDMQQ